MTQIALPTPLPDDTPQTDLWVELFGNETPAQQEQRIATIATASQQPKVMPCYCCGAPADGKPGNLRGIIVPLCKNCEGARFVVDGLLTGAWYFGKTRTEKTCVLKCPVHGKREHLDLDEDSVRWATEKRNGRLYPIRTTGGVLVYPLEWRMK